MLKMAKAMGVQSPTSGMDFIQALDALIASVGCADRKMSEAGITKEELRLQPKRVHEALGGDITADPLPLSDADDLEIYERSYRYSMQNRKHDLIHTEEAMAELVSAYGFLPLLENAIPGFSVEEHTAPEVWFADGADGPWEWKGPVIQRTGAAYGKFFYGASGFISPKWFADFANYRRDGYDFDDRFNDGLVRYEDKYLFDLLNRYDSILSTELKTLGGFGKDGRKGFDARITRLQMRGYVIISDFAYRYDQHGNRYGWGIARYSTPEKKFGAAFTDAVYQRSPEESKARILAYLKELLPQADEKQIRRMLG